MLLTAGVIEGSNVGVPEDVPHRRMGQVVVVVGDHVVVEPAAAVVHHTHCQVRP